MGGGVDGVDGVDGGDGVDGVDGVDGGGGASTAQEMERKDGTRRGHGHGTQPQHGNGRQVGPIPRAEESRLAPPRAFEEPARARVDRVRADSATLKADPQYCHRCAQYQYTWFVGREGRREWGRGGGEAGRLPRCAFLISRSTSLALSLTWHAACMGLYFVRNWGNLNQAEVKNGTHLENDDETLLRVLLDLGPRDLGHAVRLGL